MSNRRMRMIVSVISIFSFMMIGVSKAGAVITTPLNWTFAGWSGGGTFPAIVPDPNIAGRMFLLSDVAGLWRSENRGDQWVYKTSGLVNMVMASIAIAPSNSSIVYAAGEVGLYRSADAGEAWSLVTSQTPMAFSRLDSYRPIAIHRLDANKVYVGTQAGEVFTTSNGGGAWSRVGNIIYPFGQSTPITSTYLTRDAQTLFVGSRLGLLKCNLSSGTWSAIGTNGIGITDIVSYGFTETIYITYGNKVAWTADNGSTWLYSSSSPIANSTFYRLGVSSDTGGNIKILVGWRNGDLGGALLSVNGGGSWTDIERNLNYDLVNDPTRGWFRNLNWPSSVAIDPSNSNIFYFSDSWGVWRSDDNGQSWREKIVGAGNTVGTDINMMSDGSLLVSTMDGGLLKSTDNGTTYQSLAPRVGLQGDNINGHVWKVLSKGNKIIATNSPWNLSRNQVLISEDGGANFTITSNGLPQVKPNTNTVWWQSFPRGLAIDPKNPNKVYLGMDGDNGGGFFYSNDGGYNWTRSAGQPASLRIFNGLAVDPIETNRIYWGAVGTNGGVYRSEDYGLTWTRVFSATTWITDISVGSDGKVYAAGDANGPVLYVSSNKGASWQLLQRFSGLNGSVEAITIDPNDPRRIAVSSVNWQWAPIKIFVTENGGSSWTDITADLPNGEGAAAMTFSNDGGALFMTRYAGSVYRVQLNAQDAQAPTAPTNLLATQSGNQANLVWNSSTDNIAVTGYQVLRDGLLMGTVPSTSYSDTSITAGVTYLYTIRAVDAANNTSSPSNTVTLTVGAPSDTTPPTAPSGLTAVVNGTQVTLSWTASTDNVSVVGYEIMNNGLLLGTSVSTTFVYNGVAGSTYNFTARAGDASNNMSASSSIVTVTLASALPPGPSAPTNLAANYVSSQVQLSWSAPSSATGYNLFRNDVWQKWVTSASTFDNAVTVGNVYRYKVQAFDAAGLPSPFSAEVSLTISTTNPTTFVAPTNLVANIVNSQVQLSWSIPATATSYNVFRDGGWKQWVSSPSYTDNTVTVGNVYRYKVQAFNASGAATPFSTELSVTVGTSPVVDSAAPTAPSNFAAVLTGTTANLSWSASTDNVAVTGYRVYNGTTLMGTVTSLNYSASGLTQGQSYSFNVRAIDAAGNASAVSNSASVTIPFSPDTIAPSTPSNLTASLSGTTATLLWVASTDNVAVTGYRIFDGATQNGTTTSLTYQLTGLAVGSHTLSVKAVDAAGNLSASSNVATVTVASTAPGTPANLIAFMSGQSVSVAWSSAVNAAGYSLYRNGAFLVNLIATSMTDSNVTAGQTYSYQVLAFNSAGVNSGFSNSMSVAVPLPPDTTAPSVPANLAASLSGTTANLSWLASTDNVAVTGYQVFQGAVLKVTTTVRSYSVNGLVQGQAYSFTVKALDAVGNVSASSNTASVTVPDTTAPTAPTSLTTSLNFTTANLAWASSTDNIGVIGYQIFQGTTLVNTTTENVFSVTGLSLGQTYTFTVKALDAAGNLSQASNAVSVTVATTEPAPGIPGNFRASAGSNGNVSISWTTSVGAAGYNLYRNGVFYKSLGGTTYGEHPGSGTWRYKLQAYNSSGVTSGFTAEISVKTLK